jgi:hypothetical protein
MTSKYLTLRVLAFLVLVAGVNLWLDHHMAWRVANSSAVSMVVAAVAGGLGLVEKLVPERTHATMMSRALGVARVVFWTPLLVVGWGLALVLALTLSSVTVVPEAEGAKFTATLTPGAEPRSRADDAYVEVRSSCLPAPRSRHSRPTPRS